MKRIKHSILLLLVAFLGFNIQSFAGERDEIENRNVKSFDAIKVSAGIDLYITMGNNESVKVVADDDIIDNVKTEVRGGTLHVYMKNNNSWFNIFNWGSTRSKKVYVTVNELKRLCTSSGSDVKAENTLKGDELQVEVSSGSDVNLDVIYKDVSLKASSGSDARINGRAKTFSANASSGSDINARGLEAAICNVSVSSGADASVTVTDELNANASSGADVIYYGNPVIKNIDESSGGDVSKK